MNFVVDAFIQPTIASIVEAMIWMSIFAASGKETIAGFDLNSYLSYAIWAMFFARTTTSWMYEFKMVAEIESGTINSLLVRPMSFFEYYLSQMVGYKLFNGFISFLIPLAVVSYLDLPIHYDRLGGAFLLVFYYLFFLHIMGIIVATFAFHLNRVYAFIGAKNLTLWLFTGELFPLDLIPAPLNKFFILLPFSSAVYIPNAYLAGRVGPDVLLQGFASVTTGIVAFGAVAYILWKQGLKSYVGTGA